MSEKIQFLPPEDLIPTFIMSAMSETEDWGLLMAGIPAAHKHTKGNGIIVAVLDSGGPNHFDLNDNLLPALNCAGTQTADDLNGHSSHCCGIIGALENGVGVVGVAPSCKIVPIKVLDNTGHSGFQQIICGIRSAIDAGVDIISMSLGSPIEPPQELHDVIKEADRKGIIMFAAAGNDAGAVNFPACYDEVIAVAAIDQNGNIAKFSSRGDKVAVGAPGVDIYSTYLNNQYAQLSGTSQACPFMAGVAALILSWTRVNPAIPQVRCVQDMLNRLDDLCDPAGRVAVHGREGILGFGIPRFLNIFPDDIS